MQPIWAASAFVAFALVCGAGTPADASRPAKPPYAGATCKGFIHGNVGKARKLSKAKARARRKWQTKARFQAGHRYRKWDWALERHYDCRKKGKWHHCQAGGYPCHEIKEVRP